MSTNNWFDCCLRDPSESQLTTTTGNAIFKPGGRFNSIQASKITTPRAFIPLGFKYSLRRPINLNQSPEMDENDNGWVGVSRPDSGHTAYTEFKSYSENCNWEHVVSSVSINETRNCSEKNKQNETTFSWHNDIQSALNFWEQQENQTTSSARSQINGKV